MKIIHSWILINMLSITPYFCQNSRGFYVDKFHTILGNQNKEDSLLFFARQLDFNYLTLYNLYESNNTTSLTSEETSQSLANFIRKAKSQFGINKIGVVAENYNFFKNVIHIYNQQHSDSLEKIDIYNLEFEFWVPTSVETGGVLCEYYLVPNGYSCDSNGAFTYYLQALMQIDSLANSTNCLSETYLGNFDDAQGMQIIESGIDRILKSFYIPSATYSPFYEYNFFLSFFQNLISNEYQVELILLYSGENEFMNEWLDSHLFSKPYEDFVTSNINQNEFPENINLGGYHWFDYSDIRSKNTQINSPIIEIFPNPSTEKINFIIEDYKNTTVTLSDELGQIVYQFIPSSILNTLEISNFNSGVYFVNCFSNNIIVKKKLIINQ